MRTRHRENGAGVSVLLAVGLAVALVAMVAGLAAPSRAAFPGENGRIAFHSTRDGNNEIHTINPDGTDPGNLTNNPAADMDPAFSPDGRKIAFVSDRDLNSEIYVMDSGGTNQTNLTNTSLQVEDTQPAFSPDGSRIAFVSNRDGNNEIYVINADGTGTPTRLTDNAANDADPAFSPNGELIAFRSNRDHGSGEIYVMNADGTGTPNRLTNNTVLDANPNFSPDGTRIAFNTSRDGNGEIYVMGLTGNNQTNLTNNPTLDIAPAFSPDGSKIAFATERDGNREIYAMNADGSGTPSQITNNPAFDTSPDWQPLFNTDLALIKRDSAAPATVGEDLTYTITVTNEGSTNTAHDIVVKDRLPASVAFVSASDGCAESNGLVTCDLADIPPGEEDDVEVVVRPAQEGVITNTAWVSSVADPNPENDSDRERTEVIAEATDPPPDTTPPETTITSGPEGPTDDSTPTFEFESNEENSTFECRFDGDEFGACSGPGNAHTPAAPLANGEHTFEVRATDSSDNADPTPASRIFTVDAPDPRGCTITGTEGNDRNLRGASGDDVICGLGGNDRIYGLGGDDTLFGDAGRDTMNGGGGSDTLFGGEDNDSLTGSSGSDEHFGEGDNDTLRARDGVRGNDLADGGDGVDRCATDREDTRVNCP